MIRGHNRLSELNEINQIWLQVPKEQSSFVYFQLEANEGLCFYSTTHKNLQHCILHLQYHISLTDEVNQLLNYLNSKIEIKQFKNDPVADEA